MPAEIIAVDSIEVLDSLFTRSNTRPVVLFKHSNSCGISAHIFEQMSTIDGVINVVVVQSHRDVSNAVEERTGFRHQSPQAFVIRDGRAIYHATHYAIDPAAIDSCLRA